MSATPYENVIVRSTHTGKRESLLRVYWSIYKIFVFPLVALLPIGGQAGIIRQDCEKWMETLFGRRYLGLSDLLYLLARYPEFRSLYFYRVSHGSLIGEVTSLIARIFFKPMPTLHLTCPEIGPGFFIQH